MVVPFHVKGDESGTYGICQQVTGRGARRIIRADNVDGNLTAVTVRHHRMECLHVQIREPEVGIYVYTIDIRN